jgi:uncharacterized membrane protein YqaE (UPF0057 family)
VGPVSTALLFLGGTVGAFFNQYISRIPYPYLFFFGASGNTLFISLAILFLKVGFTQSVEVIILLLSFVSGLITSVYYNGQFNYINVCSQIDK